MKTQFVYKREVEHPEVAVDAEKGILATDAYTETVLDSFNLDCVIRSMTMDNGGLLVLLDDLHERYDTKAKVHPKTGAPKFDRKGQMIFERVKDVFQSEIFLSKEEGQEFLLLTAVNTVKL